jgi:hypothetical protein
LGRYKKTSLCLYGQGVAMLSGILNSDIAIEVNIRIIRIFTKLREMLLTHKDSEDIKRIFTALKELLIPPEQKERQRIGFRRQGEER